MFLGFFAWYRGLALGGVAKVSQVQLAQPLLTVGESVVLFGQPLEAAVVVTAVAVLACVAAAQRSRVVRPAAAARDVSARTAPTARSGGRSSPRA
jgi:drug/metabolite transporter (DMT)-like permease